MGGIGKLSLVSSVYHLIMCYQIQLYQTFDLQATSVIAIYHILLIAV